MILSYSCWFFEVFGGFWHFLVILKVLGCVWWFLRFLCFLVVFGVFWGLLFMVLGDSWWFFEVLGGSRKFLVVFGGSQFS